MGRPFLGEPSSNQVEMWTPQRPHVLLKEVRPWNLWRMPTLCHKHTHYPPHNGRVPVTRAIKTLTHTTTLDRRPLGPPGALCCLHQCWSARSELSGSHPTTTDNNGFTCRMNKLPVWCRNNRTIASPVGWTSRQFGAVIIHLCIVDHVLVARVHLTHNGHLQDGPMYY